MVGEKEWLYFKENLIITKIEDINGYTIEHEILNKYIIHNPFISISVYKDFCTKYNWIETYVDIDLIEIMI